MTMRIDLVVSLLIILLIIILLFLIYSKNKLLNVEKFVSNPTSSALYNLNNSTGFDNQMYLYRNTLGDINDLLLVYGCGINLGETPTALDELVKSSTKDLYTMPFNVLTNNYQDVQSKIFNLIQKYYDKNNRMTIEGQVYVVIAQAPFYRDGQNNVIANQYNANNYLYSSTNVMTGASVDANPIIQFNGYLIFTAYDGSGRLIIDTEVRKNAILNIKKNFRQKEKLCFMACPNHSNLPCGCASQKTPYISNCLESDNSDSMSAGEKYTYAILYRVNPRFADLIGREILAVDYSDYQWSPSSLNTIPTKEKPVIPPPIPLNISTKPEETHKKIPSPSDKGVILYQDCHYKGWKSKVIPPGKYTMEQLKQNYNVKDDASSYKHKGHMLVQLYKGDGFTKPVFKNNKYHAGNVNCFKRYKDLDDHLKGIEIVKPTNANKKL